MPFGDLLVLAIMVLPYISAVSREVLAMRRKLLGNHHPELAATLMNLSRVLKKEGKLAEAEAAVSDERTHAELQGQSRGASVVGFGRRHVRAVAM